MILRVRTIGEGDWPEGRCVACGEETEEGDTIVVMNVFRGEAEVFHATCFLALPEARLFLQELLPLMSSEQLRDVGLEVEEPHERWNYQPYLEQLTEEERADVEFNSGFVMAMACFYGHLSQFAETRQRFPRFADLADLRLYTASDHVFDMEIPDTLSADLRYAIQDWRARVLAWRMERPTNEQIMAMFEECRALLARIDEEVFGLTVESHYGD